MRGEATAAYMRYVSSESLIFSKNNSAKQKSISLLLSLQTSSDINPIEHCWLTLKNTYAKDLLQNSTSASNLYVDVLLESLRTFEYAAVLRSVSPSNSSA